MSIAPNKPSSPIILNVDNDESVRYTRSRILSDAGYRLIEAATGEETLRRAAANRPDVIVLNATLPDMDGSEVFRRLKTDQRTSHIMVLQVSSVHSAKKMNVGLDDEADGLLIEPIEPVELLAAVRSLRRLADREKDNQRLLQRLSQSEGQFVEATDMADCGLWDWHIPSGKLEWFGAHERLAGLPRGGFSGKIQAFTDILHPDDRPRVWEKLQEAMDKREERFSDEYRFVHPDGSIHWMAAKGRFFYDDAGRPVRMTGVVHDITARKQTEDKLKQYRTIMAGTADGIAFFKLNGGYIEQNMAHRALLNYSDEELQGRTPALQLGEETFRKVSEELIETGRYAGEVRSRRKDGQWLDFSLSAFGIYDDKGNVLCYVGILRDISERKRQEAVLRESEARLAAIFEQSTAGIAQTDLTGRFTMVNDRYCEITGRSRETLLTLRMQDITHPEDLPANLEKFRPLAEDRGGSFVIEKRYLKPDGSVVWVHNEVSAIRDATGRIRYITAVAADITENKKREHFIRRITDVAPSILYVYDLEERRNVWGNHEMFAWLGYSHDEIGAMASDLLQSLIHPDDWPRYVSYAERLRRLNDGEVAEFEYRMRHADGSYRWLHSRDTVFERSGDGMVKQIAGSALDISDRKLAENAMVAAHDTFRHLVEQSPFGVYAIDADFRLVQVSAGAQKVFGNIRPLLGQDFAEVLRQIWPEPFASEAIGRFRHTLETGEPYHAPSTVERRHDTGEVETYDWKIERLMLPDGRWGVVCHFYDLSERQRYEVALKDSKERFRLALESADMGSWDVDLRTGEAVWNRRHAEMQGYGKEGPHSMDQWRDRVHPEDLDRVLAAAEQAKRDRTPFVVEHRVRLPETAVERWLSLYGRFTYDEAGEPVRFSGVSFDITERKRDEVELSSRARQQQALAALGQAVLSQTDLQIIFELAVDCIVRTLDVQLCKVLELLPSSQGVLLRAGVGWHEGLVGHATVSTGPESQAGYTLAAKKAVIVDDLRTETRFSGPPLLRDHGVVSGMSCIILGAEDRPWGVLGAHTTSWRRFTQDDVAFLQGVANVLAGAIQREQAETELARLAAIVRSTEDAVIGLDRQAVITNWNHGAQQLYGYSPEEMIGRPFTLLIPSERSGEEQRMLDRTLEGDRIDPYETVRRHKDGRLIDVSLTISPIRNLQGRIIGVSKIARDITERKHAESALRESEERFRTLADNISQFAWMADPKGWIFWYNRRWFDYTGTTLEEMQGWGWQKVHHPDHLQRVVEKWRRVHETGDVWEDTFPLRGRDGQYRWFLSRAVPIRDDQGHILRWFGTNTDITDRREAEQAQAHLAAIVTSSDDAIISTDLNGVITSWNRGADRLYGYTEEDVVGLTMAILMPPERIDEERELLIRIRKGVSVEHYETVQRRKDGTLLDISLTVSPIRDDAGQIIGASKVARDITERRRQEEELRRLKDELEARVQERTAELLATQGRLMAVTSQLSLTEQRERRKLARDLHDYLAQLLVVGQMKGGMLKKQLAHNPASSNLLQDLDKVFQQALVYTRTLIAELSPPSLEDSGLPAALKWLAERFEKDGLRVDVRADGVSIPLAEEQAVVVFQAVRELLFNVMKHAGVAGATVTVTMNADSVLRVAVADRGKGFSSDALQRSAQPGHLGLVSVRERFRAMGGRVEVESLPGRGTTVTLCLPLGNGIKGKASDMHRVSERPVAEDRTVGSRPNVASRIRVLLVDDHKLVRQGLRDLLAADERIRVVGEAGACEEALMLAANVAPDVVVTDINLPGVNGIEMTKRFKALHPQMTVIGLSAHTEEHMKRDILSAGAETLLSKECAADDLIPAIIQYHDRQVAGR